MKTFKFSLTVFSILLSVVLVGQDDSIILSGDYETRSRGENISSLEQECKNKAIDSALEKHIFETFPDVIASDELRNDFLVALRPLVQNIEASTKFNNERGSLWVGVEISISNGAFQSTIQTILDQ